MISFYYNNKRINITYQFWDNREGHIFGRYLSRIDGNHNSGFPQYYNISSVKSACTDLAPFKLKNNKLFVVKDII